MQHGYQCGMIWGSSLAAGAEAYRLHGATAKAETLTILAAQRLVHAFQSQKGTINCLEITDIDKSSSGWEMFFYFFVKGGTIGCMRTAKQFAPAAFSEITSALSDEDATIPPGPVSCASILARHLNASELHTVMASGLAGGIGLCGGACGALGAAIWFISLKNSDEKSGKVDFRDPRGLALIEEFMKVTDYEFECSRITGRKFDSVQDHADYLQHGGCAELLETLAMHGDDENPAS